MLLCGSEIWQFAVHILIGIHVMNYFFAAKCFFQVLISGKGNHFLETILSLCIYYLHPAPKIELEWTTSREL